MHSQSLHTDEESDNDSDHEDPDMMENQNTNNITPNGTHRERTYSDGSVYIFPNSQTCSGYATTSLTNYVRDGTTTEGTTTHISREYLPCHLPWSSDTTPLQHNPNTMSCEGTAIGAPLAGFRMLCDASINSCASKMAALPSGR